MKITHTEQVINYLLSLEPQYRDHKKCVVLLKKSYENSSISHISETDVAATLYDLESQDYISIDPKIKHTDLTFAIPMILNPKIFNYFKNKKIVSKTNHREWVRTYLPVTISIIALLKSYGIDFILLGKQLLSLLWK